MRTAAAAVKFNDARDITGKKTAFTQDVEALEVENDN